MTFLTDIHTHTSFCDGKNTPAEMAARAFELGFSTYGFSGHGFTGYDSSYCMTREKEEQYIASVLRERALYEGRMEILLGIEADLYSDEDGSRFDYVISSQHYIPTSEGLLPLDSNPEGFERILREHFAGDFDSLAQVFYEQRCRPLSFNAPVIIGHLDLITKYRDLLHLEGGKKYYDAAFDTIDLLVERGYPIELNVGAITRGYRTTPYPDERLMKRILERKGRIILGGDCHSADNLGKNLGLGLEYARSCGFRSRLILTGDGFSEQSL